MSNMADFLGMAEVVLLGRYLFLNRNGVDLALDALGIPYLKLVL